MVTDARQAIAEGRTALGIELGSTRIKAVLTDADYAPLAVRQPRLGEPVRRSDLDLLPGCGVDRAANSATPHLPPMCSNATASS